MNTVELVELGLIPIVSITSSILTGVLLRTRLATATRLIVVSSALLLTILNLRIFTSIITSGISIYYRFSGFPAPLGIMYVADEINSFLALYSSIIILIAVIYSLCYSEAVKQDAFYPLLFLLIAGVHGCLFTFDLFNFYVSLELVAITSYALTALNKENKGAIRAAFIYGIYGTVFTSIVLLVAILIYGTYGSLNIIEVSMKTVEPELYTPFSGNVYGEVTVTAKISLVLLTWVFMFKSGIIPNHFWLPEVYRYSPLIVVVCFSAFADILGVYGLTRLYQFLYIDTSVIAHFRNFMIVVLFAISAFSALVASAIVSRQNTVRGLIAYSSIAQFSLATFGVTVDNPEGLAGLVLHLVANGLGDALVLLSTDILFNGGLVMVNKFAKTLVFLSLVTGLLNLFGIIPLFPGFWSKAMLVLGLVNAGNPMAATIVLASSGLCALGYFRLIFRLSNRLKHYEVKHNKHNVYQRIVIVSALTAITLSLGVLMTISREFRAIYMSIIERSLDRDRLFRIYLEQML